MVRIAELIAEPRRQVSSTKNNKKESGSWSLLFRNGGNFGGCATLNMWIFSTAVGE
jgi:hypothetical protein